MNKKKAYQLVLFQFPTDLSSDPFLLKISIQCTVVTNPMKEQWKILRGLFINVGCRVKNSETKFPS